MSFDVINSEHVAGGEPFVPAPLDVEGLFVEPPQLAQSEQLTGDDDTTFIARYTGGRVKIFGVVRDFPAAETTLVDTTTAQYAQGALLFTVGNAVWFTQVAVQHRAAGLVSILYVPGAIAALASAVVPTFAEIVTALGLGEGTHLVILGDIRYTRTSDTVIDVATSDARRPAYVDTDTKTGYTADVLDPTSLGERFWGYVDLPLDLTTAYNLGAGVLAVDSYPLPQLPYGGRIGRMKYVSAVAAVGAGGDITLLTGIDGTPVTDSTYQLLVAALPVPSTVGFGGTPSAADTFKPGDGLDIEVDAAATAYTAGSGVIKVEIFEFVPR